MQLTPWSATLGSGGESARSNSNTIPPRPDEWINAGSGPPGSVRHDSPYALWFAGLSAEQKLAVIEGRRTKGTHEREACGTDLGGTWHCVAPFVDPSLCESDDRDACAQEALEEWLRGQQPGPTESLRVTVPETLADGRGVADYLGNSLRRNGLRVPAGALRTSGTSWEHDSPASALAIFADLLHPEEFKSDATVDVTAARDARGNRVVTSITLRQSTEYGPILLQGYLFDPDGPRGPAPAAYYSDQGVALDADMPRPVPLPFEASTSENGDFGHRPHHPVHGKPSFHEGVDFATPMGVPLRAPVGGTVRVYPNGNGYGTYVVIHHNDAERSLYAHLSSVMVEDGTTVRPGQLIALSGGKPNTPGAGTSTGPHVHYEFRVGPNDGSRKPGEPQNPVPLFTGKQLEGKPLDQFRKTVERLLRRTSPTQPLEVSGQEGESSEEGAETNAESVLPDVDSILRTLLVGHRIPTIDGVKLGHENDWRTFAFEIYSALLDRLASKRCRESPPCLLLKHRVAVERTQRIIKSTVLVEVPDPDAGRSRWGTGFLLALDRPGLPTPSYFIATNAHLPCPRPDLVNGVEVQPLEEECDRPTRIRNGHIDARARHAYPLTRHAHTNELSSVDFALIPVHADELSRSNGRNILSNAWTRTEIADEPVPRTGVLVGFPRDNPVKLWDSESGTETSFSDTLCPDDGRAICDRSMVQPEATRGEFMPWGGNTRQPPRLRSDGTIGPNRPRFVPVDDTARNLNGNSGGPFTSTGDQIVAMLWATDVGVSGEDPHLTPIERIYNRYRDIDREVSGTIRDFEQRIEATRAQWGSTPLVERMLAPYVAEVKRLKAVRKGADRARYQTSVEAYYISGPDIHNAIATILERHPELLQRD